MTGPVAPTPASRSTPVDPAGGPLAGGRRPAEAGPSASGRCGAAQPSRTSGDVRLLASLLAVLAVSSGVRLAVRARDGPPPVSARPFRIDVNHASRDELSALPGIGPELAGRIDAARREGPFRCAEDLLRVPGIGPAVLRRIAPHAEFGARHGDE